MKYIYFLLLAITLSVVSTKAQEVYTINSTADDEFAYPYDDPDTEIDESEDGICGDEQGRCTLRAAIGEAQNRNTSAKFIFSISGTINLIEAIYLEDFCEIDGENQIEISGGFGGIIVAQNNTKIKGLRVSTMFGVQLEGNNNIVGDFPNYNEFVNCYVGLTVNGDNNKIFNNYFGINDPSDYQRVTNTAQYIAMTREAYRAGGQWSSPADDAKIFNVQMDNINKGIDTDWAALMLHRGTVQNNHIYRSVLNALTFYPQNPL